MNLGYKRRSYSYEGYQGYQGFKVFFIVVSCTWVYLGLEFVSMVIMVIWLIRVICAIVVVRRMLCVY